MSASRFAKALASATAAAATLLLAVATAASPSPQEPGLPTDPQELLRLATDSRQPMATRMQAIELVAIDPALVPALEPLLRDTDPKVQARVVRLLGERRHAAAIARARELLTSETHAPAPLKVAAIEVLRAEGGPASIRTLLKVASTDSGDARVFAFKSLSVMDRGAVLVVLLPLLTPAAAPSDALVAIDLIAHANVPETTDALRGALDHADPQVQAAAMRALGAAGDRAMVRRLERAATNFDPIVAAAAIEALTRLKAEDAAWREKLRELTRSSRPEIRRAAAESFATLDDPAAAATLLPLLDDRDWSVREVAIAGLARARAREAVLPLIERLGRERLRLREGIAQALHRTTGMALADNVPAWRRWWSDHGKTFVVPPLVDVDALEARLARSRGEGRAYGTFYGIPITSDHLALVLDTSGSMAEPDRHVAAPRTGERGSPRAAGPTKLDVAKAESVHLLEKLPANAYFNLIVFSSNVECWRPRSVEVTKTSAAHATDYVMARAPNGSTNLYDALSTALEDTELDTIYVLSDGMPTIGKIVAPGELRAAIQRQNAMRRVQIHTISLGAPSGLMKLLADDSGGTYVER